MAIIDKPSDHFNTKLYTGNESTRSETGVGFQPDWTWIKVRSRADPHILTDVVRGTSSQLSSDTAAVQQTFSNMITSFNSDGFSLGANVDVNRNSETFVAWNWLAANGTASNTTGSTNSTVSVNTTSGFSIVSYTGNGSQPSTVGHGLGVTPQVVLVKPRSDAQSWCMYHESIGNTKVTYLDSTSASGSSLVWNNTSPTSSVFTVNDNQVNSNTITYIAYCFAEKQGYSKFGSYSGNNNADGAFIYTGFKPAFVLVKRYAGGSQSWGIVDNKRSSYNLISAMLNPDSTGSEGGNNGMDLLSNGFKMRSSDGNSNGYTDGYIYMAFAENPFVTSTGNGSIPATAR